MTELFSFFLQDLSLIHGKPFRDLIFESLDGCAQESDCRAQNFNSSDISFHLRFGGQLLEAKARGWPVLTVREGNSLELTPVPTLFVLDRGTLRLTASSLLLNWF